MHFTPTELELRVMRALDSHPWYPAPAIAQATLDPVADVRFAMAELRRFELVVGDGRGGVGRQVQRFCLSKAGQACLIDTLRRRVLDGCRVIAA